MPLTGHYRRSQEKQRLSCKRPHHGTRETLALRAADVNHPGSDLVVISLGAGVQSTTMALMAKHVEIQPMPYCAIFADTQWEPKAVYEHLDWLESELPFPVHRITRGDIRANILNGKKAEGRFVTVPFFTEGGMGPRQCTREYKIEPIEKKIRELLGFQPGERIAGKGIEVEQWLGISTDEIQRMKDARKSWIKHRFPLVEARMSRHDCMRWLERHGYPIPPKSACIGCPYHSDAHWREMRKSDPKSWNDAVEVDRAIRAGGPLRGMKAKQFMHRSCKPLSEVDLSTAEDHGQLNWLDECDGMCGV